MSDQIICDFIPAVKGNSYSDDETFIIPDTYNLTNANIRMFLAMEIQPNVVMQALTTENQGIQIIDSTSYATNFGIINLAVGVYKYDIKVTFISGDVKTWVKGKFFVTDTITN